MAIVVKLNTRMTSAELGVIQADNNSYWDPVTKVNLNRGNPTSADLTSFSSAQLVNISNAVKSGRLTLVSGSLPAATDTFSTYSLHASAGVPGGSGWNNMTSVAAFDALQPKNSG